MASTCDVCEDPPPVTTSSPLSLASSDMDVSVNNSSTSLLVEKDTVSWMIARLNSASNLEMRIAWERDINSALDNLQLQLRLFKFEPDQMEESMPATCNHLENTNNGEDCLQETKKSKIEPPLPPQVSTNSPEQNVATSSDWSLSKTEQRSLQEAFNKWKKPFVQLDDDKGFIHSKYPIKKRMKSVESGQKSESLRIIVLKKQFWKNLDQNAIKLLTEYSQQVKKSLFILEEIVSTLCKNSSTSASPASLEQSATLTSIIKRMNNG